MGVILYRCALDRADTIVEIADVRAGRALGPFTCPGCGGALIAKAWGTRRAPHFAHASSRPCGGETYLHGLAKRTFAAAYFHALDDGLPYPIVFRHQAACDRFVDELGTPCAGITPERRYNLARRYGALRVEPRHGAFIPDVLLENVHDAADTLYVEFAVTHELSPAKAGSDRRIVEVSIAHEDDCRALERGLLDPAAYRLVNVDPPTLRLPPGECRCAAHQAARLEVFADCSWRVREGVLERLVAEPVPSDRLSEARFYGLLRAPVGTVGHALDIDALFDRARAQGLNIRGHRTPGANAMPTGQPTRPISQAARRAVGDMPRAQRSCFSCLNGHDTFARIDEQPIACRHLGRQVRHNAAVGCDAFAPRGRSGS